MGTGEHSLFGTALQRHRVAAGLTQEELANRTGLSVRGISDLERGVNTRPRTYTIRQLAAALRLSPEDQMAFEEVAQRGRSVSPSGTHRPPVGGFLGALPPGPLIAREAEEQQIHSALDAVTRGTGQLVLLRGEPGAGKTRLAQEVTLVARERGFLIATGRCYEPEQGVPFYPFVEALAFAYHAAPEALRAAVPARWPDLARLLPEQRLPLAAPTSPSREDQLRLFRSVTAFLEALAGRTPVAVLLDDLHWADDSSLGLLQHLARYARAARILLVGTSRIVAQQHPVQEFILELKREQLVEELTVGPLTPDGTKTLAAATLGGPEISEQLAHLLQRQTEGNPFFLRELLRDLVERGDLLQQDGLWVSSACADRTDGPPIPESVRAVVLQRVRRLPQEIQEVLAEASVLGQLFTFDDLQALSGRPEDHLEDVLNGGGEAGLVRGMGNDRYGFSHVLIQQALYTDIAPRRRKRLHRAAGSALETLSAREMRAAEIAWHFLQGGVEAQALPYLLLAGDQAERVFARAVEATHALPAEEEDRALAEAAALAKLGQVLQVTGRYDEALEALERAAGIYQAAGDLEHEGEVTAHIGRVHFFRGTAEEGVTRIESVLSRLDQREVTPVLATLYTVLAMLTSLTDRGLAFAEQAAERARELGDERLLLEVDAWRCYGLFWAGRHEEGGQVLEVVIPRAEAMGNLGLVCRGLGLMGRQNVLRGEFDRSSVYLEREMELAERIGDPEELAWALNSLGFALFFSGDWGRARSSLERAVDLSRLVRSHWSPYPLIDLAKLALAEGTREEASSLLEEATAMANETADRQQIVHIQTLLAKRDLMEGQPARALSRLRDGESPLWVRENVTELLPVLAEAYLALGNMDRATEVARESEQRAKERHHCIALVDALRVHGMVSAAEQQWGDAARIFQEAVRLARVMPYPYAEGCTLSEWGLMAHRMGEAVEARERLDAACRIFGQLGAHPSLERAQQALARLNTRESES